MTQVKTRLIQVSYPDTDVVTHSDDGNRPIFLERKQVIWTVKGLDGFLYALIYSMLYYSRLPNYSILCVFCNTISGLRVEYVWQMLLDSTHGRGGAIVRLFFWTTF